MPKFVMAVNKNGRKQRIPSAWLDDPVLGEDFKKTPSARAEGKAKAPATVDAGSNDKPPASGDKE